MTTEKLYKVFKLNNSKGRDGETRNGDFIRKYGDVSFEDAFNVYMETIGFFMERRNKINLFEKHLISINAQRTDSKVSESRYYSINGNKYRFSGHIYPTGSMTDLEMGIYDFAANPELIDQITF